jgi:hypothetical protein
MLLESREKQSLSRLLFPVASCYVSRSSRGYSFATQQPTQQPTQQQQLFYSSDSFATATNATQSQLANIYP